MNRPDSELQLIILGHSNHRARSRAMFDARGYPDSLGRPTIPIPTYSAQASHGNLLKLPMRLILPVITYRPDAHSKTFHEPYTPQPGYTLERSAKRDLTGELSGAPVWRAACLGLFTLRKPRDKRSVRPLERLVRFGKHHASTIES